MQSGSSVNWETTLELYQPTMSKQFNYCCCFLCVYYDCDNNYNTIVCITIVTK